MKILLAEYDKKTRTLFKDILVREGFEVIEASTGNDAIHEYESNLQKPDIIVLDHHLPYMSGLKVTEKILQRNSDARIFILTSDSTIDLNGFSGERVTLKRKPLGCQDFLHEINKIVQT
ncbi:MAG: response regulator [Candidatus Heimdallarchaeota archaeon]|nr:response regulator [Candidatus Heimdallarchaeota archaeon]